MNYQSRMDKRDIVIKHAWIVACEKDIGAAQLLAWLIELWQIFGEQSFFFQDNRMQDLCLMSLNRLKDKRKKLIKLGFITTTRSGIPPKLYYTYNSNVLMNAIENGTDPAYDQNSIKTMLSENRSINETSIKPLSENRSIDELEIGQQKKITNIDLNNRNKTGDKKIRSKKRVDVKVETDENISKSNGTAIASSTLSSQPLSPTAKTTVDEDGFELKVTEKQLKEMEKDKLGTSVWSAEDFRKYMNDQFKIVHSQAWMELSSKRSKGKSVSIIKNHLIGAFLENGMTKQNLKDYIDWYFSKKPRHKITLMLMKNSSLIQEWVSKTGVLPIEKAFPNDWDDSPFNPNSTYHKKRNGVK
jgi:hypothetical protein